MEDRAVQDRRLVRSILEGDHDLFADLVARYQRMAAGVAWRYGVRSAEIEDVVSEVFVKAFRQLHRYRPEHPFSTWLYRLAVNHVIDHGRRASRESGRTELPLEIEDRAARPGEGLESRERISLLRAALGRLPQHYREALFLVYVEGKQLDETARLLGVPRGTIKSRLMRGRTALRRILVRRHPGYFGA